MSQTGTATSLPAVSSAPDPRRERVWFAHAIRGPACILVVLAHLADVFPNDQTAAAAVGHFSPVHGLPSVPWAGALRVLAAHDVTLGAVGVLLFFLVSGFVIPFSLERGDPRGFAFRRFCRLYPTLWACLAVTVTALVVQGHLLHTSFPYGRRTLVADGLLIAPYTKPGWVEPVLWSLAVEELFYLVAAILGWRALLARRGAVLGVAAGVAAVALATRTAVPGSPLFWLGFNATFVTVILVGVALHQRYRRRWSTTDCAVVAGTAFATYLMSLHNGPAAAVSGIYTVSAVIALAAFGALFAARDHLPYSRTVDRLSDVSYPLYLLHGVNGYVVLRAVFVATGNYYLGLAAALAAAVAVAAAIHVLVETPTNDFGRRLARRLPPRPTRMRLRVPARNASTKPIGAMRNTTPR